MTGGRVAYPVLLSIANIHMNVRMKASHHALLLTALLPCAKFLTKNKKTRSILNNRLVHRCLDIITEPLKMAAQFGRMMNDPLGYQRFCFTPLVSYIADTPEASLIAGVGPNKTSHLTMATFRGFDDPFQHEPRSGSTTLAQLDAMASRADPEDITEYAKLLHEFRLNGVYLLFWRNWGIGCFNRQLADPYRFLTPEVLHHWHKAAWDHDIKWAIRALGAAEIDFRFSILPPTFGFRRFREGISELKQVTGREHRDIQSVLIALIAGAAPREFVTALRALMDFRYLGQEKIISSTNLAEIKASLAEFHQNKQSILDAGARVGTKGNVMEHFQIPKLELMQSVVPSITWTGVPIQWSADPTEHAHVTEVKIPVKSGNNKSFEPQICRWLDHSEKRRHFDLATSIQEASGKVLDEVNAMVDAGYDSDNDAVRDAIEPNNPDPIIIGPARLPTNFFTLAQSLSADSSTTIPRPLRTFAINNIAFHLNYTPDISRITVDQAAEMFCLPDLRPALADYISRFNGKDNHSRSLIGGRRHAQPDATLPCKNLRVWYSFRMQTKSMGGSNDNGIALSQKVGAVPKKGNLPDWPLGRFDTVLLSDGAQAQTDKIRGLHGAQPLYLQL